MHDFHAIKANNPLTAIGFPGYCTGCTAYLAGEVERVRAAMRSSTRTRPGCESRAWLRKAAGLALSCLVGLAPEVSAPAWSQVRTEAKAGGSSGAWSAQARGPRATATAIRLDGDAQRTRIRLYVTRPIAASIFTLGDPYRVIVDIADLEFQLTSGAGSSGHGIVTAYRYGQFEAGRSRIVIDAAVPVLIEKAQFVPAGREAAHLTFDLVRITPEAFAGLASSASASRDESQLRSGRHDEVPEPAVPAGPKKRPVIVLDPGHGGIDPGTVAVGNLTEKAVVLAVALQVRAILQQSRRFEVLMTRAEDTFVSLDRRLAISQRNGADLFVSIHADAIAEKELAHAVRGATIYTMSERASDEAARRLAEKENAVDRLAGLDSVPASDEDQVRSILIDLVRRETSNHAAEFRNHLLDNLKGKIPLSKDPQRAAAFKVLKQTHAPSVLVELGYMSNSEDELHMNSVAWQKQVAGSIAAAVTQYFNKRTAEHP